MTPEFRRLAVDADVALHALVWGGGADRDQVPFLLVHGLASNCRTWEAVGDRLHRSGHPVAAVDLRGHGRSDKPDHGYDFATLGEDLLAVMDGLGFASAVVAGQSTGGNLVVDLASREPGRVAAVVGVDGGSIELARRWPRWEDCETALAPPRLAGTPSATVEKWIRAGHPRWTDEAVAVTMANFEILGDGTVRPWLRFDRHIQVLASLWAHRPLPMLARLAVPALLVYADSGDDWAESKRVEAQRVVAAAERVRIEWFSPADHDIHVERPAELADLLHEFSTSGPLG